MNTPYHRWIELCCLQELQDLKKGLDSEVEQLKSVRPPILSTSIPFYLWSSLAGEAHHPVILLVGMKAIRSAVQEEKGNLPAQNTTLETASFVWKKIYVITLYWAMMSCKKLQRFSCFVEQQQYRTSLADTSPSTEGCKCIGPYFTHSLSHRFFSYFSFGCTIVIFSVTVILCYTDFT